MNNLSHTQHLTIAHLALKKRIIRDDLINQIGLNEHDYWGFMPLTNEQFLEIIKRGEIDESLIVH
ncbi:hypothetical protein [Legionella pneumophila]|uniref:hypothetical protein n=1 Tax=Legionella pneumophila TaxID=446 RepID=UPI001EE5DCF3|nr:hypothetical protein [Legionella pneumophila]UKW26185.1 hypothetical protein MBG98_00845 [Legionella pneumophila]